MWASADQGLQVTADPGSRRFCRIVCTRPPRAPRSRRLPEGDVGQQEHVQDEVSLASVIFEEGKHGLHYHRIRVHLLIECFHLERLLHKRCVIVAESVHEKSLFKEMAVVAHVLKREWLLVLGEEGP